MADAGREGEEIVLRASREAEAFLKKAADEAEKLKQERLAEAQAEAVRQSELIRATVPVERGRLSAARIESHLQSIYDEASRRLAAGKGFDYRETLITLASYAISRMEGGQFVVKVAEADGDVSTNDMAGEIERRVGRPVRVTVLRDTDVSGAGVVVEDAASRQVWDNRLIKRLERLWPELRQRIAVEAAFVPKAGSGGDSL